MKLVAAVLVSLAVAAGSTLAADAVPEPWLPVHRLVGSWIGKASGQAGEGTVVRRYAFVMNGRFIHETNITTYPPQEKNRKGEVHEHQSFISFDKARKTLVLRQFHVEGFVNTFRQAAPVAGMPATVVFESESFENFSNTWKARETYEFISDDEFVETFELAPPGKPFSTYGRSHFKRSP
jgi:hypothetical protein